MSDTTCKLLCLGDSAPFSIVVSSTIFTEKLIKKGRGNALQRIDVCPACPHRLLGSARRWRWRRLTAPGEIGRVSETDAISESGPPIVITWCLPTRDLQRCSRVEKCIDLLRVLVVGNAAECCVTADVLGYDGANRATAPACCNVAIAAHNNALSLVRTVRCHVWWAGKNPMYAWSLVNPMVCWQSSVCMRVKYKPGSAIHTIMTCVHLYY
jgi:hypothetical protein